MEVEDDSHEIFGYCELPKTKDSLDAPSLKRMVLKTDSHTVKNLQVKFKRSLTRKCESEITVRTDLQTMGVYLMKHWLLKFMCEYEQGENAIEFTNFGSEFVSFIAKNQYKQAISKHSPESKVLAEDDNLSQIAHILSPQMMSVKKDFVKCQMHILPKQPMFKIS